VSFQVITAASVNMAVFWYDAPCNHYPDDGAVSTSETSVSTRLHGPTSQKTFIFEGNCEFLKVFKFVRRIQLHV
jgi:hypothetical protein